MKAALELLEDRIAPAILLNPRTILYRDLDGDLAEIRISEPLFHAETIGSALTFSTGSVDGSDATPQQLELIDFTGLDPRAGSPISLSATIVHASHTGQAFVDLGYIKAPGVDFRSIRIHGDLGGIDAGSGFPNAVAIGRLSVESMGELGLASQAAGGTLDSSIDGSVRHLTVEADLNAVTINISGALKTLRLGGSLLGGAVAQSGAIDISGSLNTCRIAGSISGGAGAGSGTILAQSIHEAKIAGSIGGGAGNSSGSLFVNASIDHAAIGGDLRGNAGNASGSIVADGNLGSVAIAGSIVGGGGMQSGEIESFGNLRRLHVGRDLDGGAGSASGEIICNGNQIGSLIIGGGLVGGMGSFSGFIQDFGSARLLHIKGEAIGAAPESALLEVYGNVTTLRVDGPVLGGSGANSGEFFVQGNVRSAILGGLKGGAGANSGLLDFGGNAGNVRLNGSVLGGSGSASGEIYGAGNLSTLRIMGDLQGGSVAGAASATATGYVQASSFGSIYVAGSVISGTNTGTGMLSASGSIRAANQIGSLHVKGSLLGNSTNAVVISAQGAIPNASSRTDPALGSVQVDGSVYFGEILAGYSAALQPVNGHGQIGRVLTKGNWVASDLVAGIQAGSPEGFGTSADTVIPDSIPNNSTVSRIAKVVIEGEVLGSAASGDNYGFEAEAIGAFTIAGHTLLPSSFLSGIELAPTNDVIAREVEP